MKRLLLSLAVLASGLVASVATAGSAAAFNVPLPGSSYCSKPYYTGGGPGGDITLHNCTSSKYVANVYCSTAINVVPRLCWTRTLSRATTSKIDVPFYKGVNWVNWYKV